jgi:hypothetical protein
VQERGVEVTLQLPGGAAASTRLRLELAARHPTPDRRVHGHDVVARPLEVREAVGGVAGKA